MARQKVVVLSGAGISAESGINTFRGSNGLWEGHDILDVASPQGWSKNPELVLNFYNQRRRQLHTVVPNAGHKALVELEKEFDVVIITQNVDDLHERAGSSNIIHLHGELLKARSTGNASSIQDWPGDLNLGDLCEEGYQLRPHIVWFGEMVPKMDEAIAVATKADIFVVVGTSLVVYPAAGLINYAPRLAKKYLIDPQIPDVNDISNLQLIQSTATEGLPNLIGELMG